MAFQFRPLITAARAVGCAASSPARATSRFPRDDERALASILDQTAIALDRVLLARDAVAGGGLQENEKLRDALLASLSHDLRTPLAAIAGAATSLRSLGDKMTAGGASSNFCLDRRGGGAAVALRRQPARHVAHRSRARLKVKRDFVDLAEIVAGAVERSRKAFPEQPMKLNLAPDLPFVRGDDKLLEQVLFNLLDNAHKYGSDTGATIHGRREGETVVISVTDEGPGVKPADLEKIFEKFYRGGRADGRKPGTGLGLSICRGLIESMGGTIVAQSPAVRRRGTRIVVRLPSAEPSAIAMKAAP